MTESLAWLLLESTNGSSRRFEGEGTCDRVRYRSMVLIFVLSMSQSIDVEVNGFIGDIYPYLEAR